MDPRRAWRAHAVLVALTALAVAVGLVSTHGAPTRKTATPYRAFNSQEAAAADGVAPRPVVLPTHAPVPLPRMSTVQGLGDSVPAAAACGCTSYVVQLGQRLARAQGSPVTAVNDALPGQNSSALLTQVRQNGTRARSGQVTVITIGANDFDPGTLSGPRCTTMAGLTCYRSALAVLRANISALLSTLVAGGGAHGPVLVTGYWNVFEDGDVGATNGQAYVRDSDGLTLAVNAVLQAETHRHGMVYVDLYTPFKDKGNDTTLLAADGDHPSAAGHALITTLLHTALLAAPQ